MNWPLTYDPQRGGDLPGTRLVERLSVFISGGPKQEVCFMSTRQCLMLRKVNTLTTVVMTMYFYGNTWSHNKHVLISCSSLTSMLTYACVLYWCQLSICCTVALWYGSPDTQPSCTGKFRKYIYTNLPIHKQRDVSRMFTVVIRLPHAMNFLFNTHTLSSMVSSCILIIRKWEFSYYVLHKQWVAISIPWHNMGSHLVPPWHNMGSLLEDIVHPYIM